jgi:hypothetical protein
MQILVGGSQDEAEKHKWERTSSAVLNLKGGLNNSYTYLHGESRSAVVRQKHLPVTVSKGQTTSLLLEVDLPTSGTVIMNSTLIWRNQGEIHAFAFI